MSMHFRSAPTPDLSSGHCYARLIHLQRPRSLTLFQAPRVKVSVSRCQAVKANFHRAALEASRPVAPRVARTGGEGPAKVAAPSANLRKVLRGKARRPTGRPAPRLLTQRADAKWAFVSVSTKRLRLS